MGMHTRTDSQAPVLPGGNCKHVSSDRSIKPALVSTASPRRRDGIREYPMDDESLLFDPQTQGLFYLNETAYAVWRRCDGRSIQELVSCLTRIYGVDWETSLGHVKEVVSFFEIGGLLAKETTDVGGT